MRRAPDSRSASRGDSRTQIVQVLKAAGSAMSIAQIAEKVRLHPNTVRFHLDVLVDSQQVEAIAPERTGRGRPPLLFRAAHGMDRTGPRQYLLLAEILTDQLGAEADPTAKAVEAGRAWGRHVAPSFHAPAEPRPEAAQMEAAQTEAAQPPSTNELGERESVELLVDLLDSLGFAPDRSAREERPQQIGVHHCPFLELAETRANLVCPIHLGLMQGAMASWNTPLTVSSLEAFAEPDLCVARLTKQPATAS